MRCLLLAFAAFALVAQPSAAQTVQPAVSSGSPHERIYDTLIAQSDDRALIESVLDWLVREVSRDPNIAALAGSNPGLYDALRDAVRPIVAGYSQRVKLAYRPRMIALLESELTSPEATEIADFYASPIGRRLVTGVAQNYRADAVLDTLKTDERVTTTHVEQDMDNATQATLQAMSSEETEQLYRELASRPAVMKLIPVVPKLAALRAEMEEEPMTADEEGAIQIAIREVFSSLQRPAPPPRQGK